MTTLQKVHLRRCASSFVIATYDKYASFLVAPYGLRTVARLASGAFYCVVCLWTFHESINYDV